MHNITDDVITPKTLKASDIQLNRGMNGENIHLEYIGNGRYYTEERIISQKETFTVNKIADILI